MRDTRLSTSTKAVALVLSTYMDARGYARPSGETLAAGASLVVKTVRKAIRELETAGFLRVERTKGGNSWTNGYLARLPETADELRQVEWARGESRVLNRGSRATNGGAGHHESFESFESTTDGASPEAKPPVVEEECWGCGEVRHLVHEDTYCIECASKLGLGGSV